MKWELNEDFYDFLVALLETETAFVVVGAHALAAHGVVRATGDLDILYPATAENTARLFAALSRFGAPVAAHAVTAESLSVPYSIYQMGLPPRRIDLINRIHGPSTDQVWANRIEVEIEGLRVPFIARQDLLDNKRARARAKDLLDVELLLKLAPTR